MTVLSVLDQSPIRHDATPAMAIHETLKLAELADRLGYHRYWLAEHHSSNGLAGSAPEVLIGQVASRTSRMRIGAGGVMLSHYSPLKVAENFRMLETLFPGRIDLGIGRAPGSDQLTDHALQAGTGAAGPQQFPAQVHDMLGYLQGNLPDEHPFARIRAMPDGPGMPEIWLLGSTDQSASLAAHFGCPFSFAYFINPNDGDRVMAAYREYFRASEIFPEPRGNVGIFVLCADTEQKAAQLMASRDLYTMRQRTGRQMPMPSIAEAEAYEYSAQEREVVAHNRHRAIWGTPEQVRDRIQELGRAYDVDEFVVVTICAEFEDRIRSYELLAEVFDLPAAAAP